MGKIQCNKIQYLRGHKYGKKKGQGDPKGQWRALYPQFLPEIESEMKRSKKNKVTDDAAYRIDKLSPTLDVFRLRC